MSARDEVVVTGVGIVSPLGVGHEAFWPALLAGNTGIAPITIFDAQGEASRLGAEVGGLAERFRSELGVERSDGLDRATMLAVLASELALRDAGLGREGRSELGVVFGTAFGPLHSIAEFDRLSLTEDPKFVSPLGFPNTVINSPASRIAIHHGMIGPNVTISTGVVAGAQAIGHAAALIESGAWDVLLAGGGEELSEEVFRGYASLGRLSPGQGGGEECCRPGDRRRNGTVLGEGAVLLVLERRDRARSRGARVYARVGGFAAAYTPEAGGAGEAAQVISQALAQAGVTPDHVGVVCAGLAGDRAQDERELAAVEAALAGAAAPVPLVAIKGATGECLGCASALQVAVAALALRDGVIPGTVGFGERDEPARRVRVEARSARATLGAALATTLDCDGGGTALLLLPPGAC